MRHRLLFTLVLAFIPPGRVAAQDTPYVPTQEYPNGRQVLAIYFGASWCRPCFRPEMKAGVARMKPLLAAQARQSGAVFSAMIVALDRDLEKGLAFVRPNGAFDEYLIGSDLVSTAAERFIWGDSLAFKGVPQVIVLERSVQAVPGQPVAFGPARVLRRVGGDSIPAWVAAGAPITR